MTHFIPKQRYKGKDPYTTIHNIRNILYDCGIFCRESSAYHSLSGTCAAELRLGDAALLDTRIATNGKGMDMRYAMASAYGEFMERLQNGCLIYGERLVAYNRGDLKYRLSPDEKEMSIAELGDDFKSFFKLLFHFDDAAYDKIIGDLSEYKLKCVPYTDIIRDKTVYLPADELFALFTSNGMCAGNDANEAMAQGISELFERDVLTRIYKDNISLNLLPEEMFEGTSVISKIRNLEENGYEAKILDCSLGLEYPVVGLVLKSEDGLMMNLGADPNPIVALERCLTEVFQLLKENCTKYRMTKDSCGTRDENANFIIRGYYDLQFLRSKKLGSGEKPDNIHNLEENYSQDYTYNDNGTDDFEYLVGLIKKLGYHLYVRDCSYLGFPAFHTVIPEISLADYRYEDIAKVFVSLIKDGYPEIEVSNQHYEALLPILKRLEDKMISNSEK